MCCCKFGVEISDGVDWISVWTNKPDKYPASLASMLFDDLSWLPAFRNEYVNASDSLVVARMVKDIW